MELDDAEYRLKPMNCPGHILIYKNSPPESYRDLPVRYAELGQRVSLRTQSGTMHGLLRVRGFTQDDAHIFCTPQQIEERRSPPASTSPKSVLHTFGFTGVQGRALHLGPQRRQEVTSALPEKWERRRQRLPQDGSLDRQGNPLQGTIPGEAAFYGPKIDIKLVDVLGRMWQLSTVQFDWNLPQRFDLVYKGEDGANCISPSWSTAPSSAR